MSRTAEQISHHYSVEKELADQLRHATESERLSLYNSVYNKLYESVPDHPMLLQSEEQAEIRRTAVSRKLCMLKPYFQKQGTFIQIGAGDCAMSIAVAQVMQNVVAIEVSDAITAKINLPENVRVAIIKKPAAVPMESQSVQLAFSDQLAEHLHPEDFLQQCTNVFESLSVGGHYVLVTPNRLNGPHDISRGFDAEATGMHLKEYTFMELSNLLLGIGFKKVKPIVGFHGHYIALPALVIKALESLLTKLPKKLGFKIANTLVVQMLLAIRLVATR